MPLAAPVLPPLLTPHAADLRADPFAVAIRDASIAAIGAGDLVWSSSESRAAFAIVLEPEVGAHTCQQMLPLMMVAVGDGLGAVLPPQLGIEFRWPDRILLNGAEAGRVRMAMAGAAAGAAPAWLVVGAEIAIASDAGGVEPGYREQVTSLSEEGAGDLDRTAIIEAISPHLLSWIDRWQADGFDALRQHWLARAEKVFSNGTLGPLADERVAGLDDAAGLILWLDGGKQRTLDLAVALDVRRERVAP